MVIVCIVWGIFQERQCWLFGGVLSSGGCLEASLASTQWMPVINLFHLVEPILSDITTYFLKNVLYWVHSYFPLYNYIYFLVISQRQGISIKWNYYEFIVQQPSEVDAYKGKLHINVSSKCLFFWFALKSPPHRPHPHHPLPFPPSFLLVPVLALVQSLVTTSVLAWLLNTCSMTLI